MQELLIKAIEYVKSAGELFTCKELDITVKSCDADLVTAVDLSVSDFLTERLKKILPDSEVLSEEACEKDIKNSEKLWVLDPVDGTLNLVHGYGRAVISLGLKINDETVLGVVYDPILNECFYALKGQGAYLNGERIFVSKRPHNEWLVAAGTSLYYSENTERVFQAMKRVFIGCCDLRRCGSAAMEICLIACGRQDAYFEIGLKQWDYTAAELILSEAGGLSTDWHGKKLQSLGTAAFSNGKDHTWFLNTLNF